MSFPAMKSHLKKGRKGHSGGREIKALKPQITSVVDIMTCLLIYLLQSFSTDEQVVTPSKNLELPISTAQKPPHMTVVLTVTDEYIMAENERVTTVDKVLATDDMTIPELDSWLSDRRDRTLHIAKYSSSTKFTGDITIQADKKIRFRLLKKIMYTCGQEGYNNFSLAVQKKDT